MKMEVTAAKDEKAAGIPLRPTTGKGTKYPLPSISAPGRTAAAPRVPPGRATVRAAGRRVLAEYTVVIPDGRCATRCRCCRWLNPICPLCSVPTPVAHPGRPAPPPPLRRTGAPTPVSPRHHAPPAPEHSLARSRGSPARPRRRDPRHRATPPPEHPQPRRAAPAAWLPGAPTPPRRAARSRGSLVRPRRRAPATAWPRPRAPPSPAARLPAAPTPVRPHHRAPPPLSTPSPAAPSGRAAPRRAHAGEPPPPRAPSPASPAPEHPQPGRAAPRCTHAGEPPPPCAPTPEHPPARLHRRRQLCPPPSARPVAAVHACCHPSARAAVLPYTRRPRVPLCSPALATGLEEGGGSSKQDLSEVTRRSPIVFVGVAGDRTKMVGNRSPRQVLSVYQRLCPPDGAFLWFRFLTDAHWFILWEEGAG
ncbi:vegetative cell wall protein gp1-like [Miscanthus floridulus]|uniref:vegetative cell wall protein gp1-like n=1 Tax=Miscanthus floridulus TaxID=154761 RepID=UPI003458067D